MENVDILEAARSGVLLYAKLIRCRTCFYGKSVLYSLQHGGFDGYHGTSINMSSLKTLNYTVDEFKELCSLARQKNLVYFEAIMYMHTPLRKVLKRQLRPGAKNYRIFLRTQEMLY